MRIFPSELQLERYEDKFRGIFAQKFSNMCKKWSQSSDSEWAMIDGERFNLIHSEIEVPEPSFELIFDIPCLTLIDDTKFMACKGASIVRSGNGDVGDEHFIINIGHPVDSEVIR